MARMFKLLVLAALFMICASKAIEKIDGNLISSLQKQIDEISQQNGMEHCSIGAIDLVVCLDASSSIQDSDFALAKRFFANLTASLKIGQSMTESRVGLLMFRLESQIIFDLKTYTSNAAVFNAIATADRLSTSDGTNIANCMNLAANVAFTAPNGARPNVPRIFIILTDGQDSSDVAGAHNNAVSKNIVTYAVGVGSDVNKDQLIAATGDPSKVYLAPNFNALKDILSDLCGQIASSVNPTMTPSAPFTTGSSSGGMNTERLCYTSKSSPKKIALDIIFALDSTQAVDPNNYQTLKSHLAEVVRLLTVDQNGGTRIGLIYYDDKAHVVGQLTDYNSSSEAATNLLNMPYQNTIKLDMKAALTTAQDMFTKQGKQNRKQVLVLTSTGCTNCKDDGRSLSPKAACDEIGPDQEDACRIAAQLKQGGLTIMTILLKLDSSSLPPISMATPCYAFANDAALTRNLVYGWFNVMCYCRDDHYSQFINASNTCQKFADCAILQVTPDTWENAQATCANAGAFLADEFSREKYVFLKNLVFKQLPQGTNPDYWIGMNDRSQSGIYMWDRGKDSPVPQQQGDYTGYGQGQPNDSNGNCIARSMRSGFNLFWTSKQCADPLDPNANLLFLCQQNACTVDSPCG